MNSPIQAKPVGRGLSRLTDGATQSGCNVLECAVAAAGCAAACIPNPFSPACVACLGPLWGSCKDCF